MVQRWDACIDGYPLYCAAWDEDTENPDAPFTAVTRPKWWLWQNHRDHCPKCKLRKDEAK